MPGKVNPVIPEAVTQAAMLVMGHDPMIVQAAAAGNLELNPFLPLVADSLLDSLLLLARACEILRRYCVEGIEADEARCRRHVRDLNAPRPPRWCRRSATTPPATSSREATERGAAVREVVVDSGLLTAEQFDELLSAEAVCRLGTPPTAAPRPPGVADGRCTPPKACACTSACSAAATSASRAC